LWTLQSPEDGVRTLELVATDVSGILVQHENGRSALTRTTRTQSSIDNDIPKAFVYGKRTQPAQLLARGAFELTGIVFRPEALHVLLRLEPADINNGPVNVDDLFACHLEDQLMSAKTARERLTVLVGCLEARVVQRLPVDDLVSESVRLIRTEVRSIRIPPLLKCLGISERQFERRFFREVGVSPHHYLRILRFQEAVRLLRDGVFDKMSDLASELNYCDQSHFIKEMKEFSGHTPTALLEAVRGAVQLPCALMLGSRRGLPFNRGRI
jgi:AraC-like DNA-binding protein